MLKLSVQNLEAGYGAVRALHGVSLEVRQGETVALLGTNGNGKSTLMKCIMGLLQPARGSIVLELDGSRIDLNASGITVIMIEHIMQAVMRFSQRVICLDAGRIICEGTPQSIVQNPDVQKAYLGA